MSCFLQGTLLEERGTGQSFSTPHPPATGVLETAPKGVTSILPSQLWPHKLVCWTGVQPLGPPPKGTQCGKLRTKTQTYEPLGNILDPNYSKQTGDIQERIDERRRKEGKGETEAGIRGGVKEAAESGRIYHNLILKSR